MTVGELLKEYRVEQNKSQKEFTAGIVSQSYYSKVEKNIHRITTDDLLLLLTHNAISVKNFFEKLEIDQHQEQVNKVNKIFKEVNKANYSNDPNNQIKKIRRKANDLEITPELKEEALLIIDGFLELYKDSPKIFDNGLRDRLKEKLFLMPEYDTYKLTLYSNFSELYNFESNRQIINQIVKSLAKKPVERQDEILFAIVLNVMKQGIEEKKDDKAMELTQIAKKIKIIPEFFLYREMLTFYEELIAYRHDNKEEHLKKCRLVLESFELGGMEALGKDIEKFLDKYKNK